MPAAFRRNIIHMPLLYGARPVCAVRRVHLACVVVLAAGAAGATPLARPQAPASAQAGPQTPPKSTALILGQVLDGTSNQPVAEAIVTLTQAGRGTGPGTGAGTGGGAARGTAPVVPGAPAASGRGSAPQRVMTGADGRFVFHGLPPGQVQLTASLTGYSSGPNGNPLTGLGGAVGTAIAALTTTGSASAPVTVPLTEGELATGVRLRLWKDAVVSGVVLDDGNEPAVGVMVQVARRIMAAGRARYLPGTSVRTDDRGAYRISSLAPGNYLVVVPQTQVAIPTSLATGLVSSLTGIVATGRGGGGDALAIVDVMSSGVNPTEAMGTGVRMGDYMVASSGSVPVVGADGRLQAYQTVFYPGAAGPVQATVVTLKSGEERADVSFTLRLIPTSRVSGTAVGPDGPVANLGIRLVVPADGAGSESEFDVATVVTKGDGTFSFYGVPPGQFLLRAQKMPRPPIPAEAMASPLAQAMFGGGGPPGTTEALYAATTVTVADADVGGVALQLRTGLHAIGRLEFESASGRQAPAANQVQALAVTLNALDGQMGSGLSSVLAAGFSTPDRPNAQGEFRTKGYAPGRYFLSVTGGAPWQVKSATFNGRDVLDAPLDLRDGDASGVLITLTDQLARVSGTVKSAGETDLSETSVYLFPSNYREWITNGMTARRARTTRASRTGTYALMNVPAGEYLMTAVDRASEGDMQDPSFIEVLARAGTRVVVGATDRTLDLVKARDVR